MQPVPTGKQSAGRVQDRRSLERTASLKTHIADSQPGYEPPMVITGQYGASPPEPPFAALVCFVVVFVIFSSSPAVVAQPYASRMPSMKCAASARACCGVASLRFSFVKESSGPNGLG